MNVFFATGSINETVAKEGIFPNAGLRAGPTAGEVFCAAGGKTHSNGGEVGEAPPTTSAPSRRPEDHVHTVKWTHGLTNSYP